MKVASSTSKAVAPLLAVSLATKLTVAMRSVAAVPVDMLYCRHCDPPSKASENLGHLAHYGADTTPLKTLIHAITAIQRDEAPTDAPLKPGDEVRLVGEVPESLADYDEMWLRDIMFVVRYVGRNAMVHVQPDLTEDYVIATVPAARWSPCEGKHSVASPHPLRYGCRPYVR
ncbi:hypothetical protein [Micromonospora sp. NPDC005324]|uniref:hypothetical protein n=1 Tax=Micromonospora sp. NPDC005324 TaxID=3157033 RepID=UPI0033AEAE87